MCLQLVFPVHVQIDNFTSSPTDVPSIESIKHAVSRQAALDQSSNVDIHVTTRDENGAHVLPYSWYPKLTSAEEPLSPDTYGVSIIQGINYPIIQDRRLSIPSSQGAHSLKFSWGLNLASYNTNSLTNERLFIRTPLPPSDVEVQQPRR